jgi:2-alkyl-3-oxoalkanoate reductase
MRYGFFDGSGTWYTNAGDLGEQVRRWQVPIIGAGQDVASFVHIEDAASATVAALEMYTTRVRAAGGTGQALLLQ